MDVLRWNQFVCIAQDKQSTLKWIDFSTLHSGRRLSTYRYKILNLARLTCHYLRYIERSVYVGISTKMRISHFARQ